MKHSYIFAVAAVIPSSTVQYTSADFSQRTVTPLAESTIIEEYVATCFAGYPSVAKVSAALESSEIEYDEIWGAWHVVWKSEYGEAYYLATIPDSPKTTPQCSFTGFSYAPVSRDHIQSGLLSSLEQAVGKGNVASIDNGFVTCINGLPVSIVMAKSDNEKEITLITMPSDIGACEN